MLRHLTIYTLKEEWSIMFQLDMFVIFIIKFLNDVPLIQLEFLAWITMGDYHV